MKYCQIITQRNGDDSNAKQIIPMRRLNKLKISQLSGTSPIPFG